MEIGLQSFLLKSKKTIQFDKMKILVVGPKHSLSSANACAAEFRRQGCYVRQFDNKPRLPALGKYRQGGKYLVHRALYNKIINRSFYQVCAQYKPDLIFTQKAENISAQVIRDVKQDFGACYALWYGDNPFFDEISSWHVIRSLRVCDICYSWGEFMIETLLSAGCRTVKHLPFAFDPIGHNPDIEIAANGESAFKADLSFVGSWDKEREAILESLVDFDLAIYGQRWREKVKPSSPLFSKIRRDSVWGEDFVKCFKGSRVVLNLMRNFNMPSHNFRTMEATGIGGGVLLTPKTREQVDLLFKEDEHIFCYENVNELSFKINSLLKKSHAQLTKVGSAAQKHVFSNHLLKHRLRIIINDFS